MTSESLAVQLGVANASKVVLSSTAYVEARIAVSVLANTGIDSTALTASHGLPEALASSPAIATDAVSFSQEPELLAPPSAPPPASPAFDVQRPSDADSPLALSDRSSPAALSSLAIVFVALGGSIVLLVALTALRKRGHCRWTLPSLATTMNEVTIQKPSGKESAQPSRAVQDPIEHQVDHSSEVTESELTLSVDHRSTKHQPGVEATEPPSPRGVAFAWMQRNVARTIALEDPSVPSASATESDTKEHLWT